MLINNSIMVYNLRITFSSLFKYQHIILGQCVSLYFYYVLKYSKYHILYLYPKFFNLCIQSDCGSG